MTCYVMNRTLIIMNLFLFTFGWMDEAFKNEALFRKTTTTIRPHYSREHPDVSYKDIADTLCDEIRGKGKFADLIYQEIQRQGAKKGKFLEHFVAKPLAEQACLNHAGKLIKHWLHRLFDHDGDWIITNTEYDRKMIEKPHGDQSSVIEIQSDEAGFSDDNQQGFPNIANEIKDRSTHPVTVSEPPQFDKVTGVDNRNASSSEKVVPAQTIFLLLLLVVANRLGYFMATT